MSISGKEVPIEMRDELVAYLERRPAFRAPEPTEITLWRYMDFTKFVSMIENRGLYFSRIDLLGDPFEGSYPKSFDQLSRLANPNVPEEAHKNVRLGRRAVRLCTFVNCWHMNDQESAAMWRLYAHSNEAIAVCSSYPLLRRCLPDPSIGIGVITYIDYEADIFPGSRSHLCHPFMHKRKSFSHERELRALIQNFPTRSDHMIDLAAAEGVSGHWKAVDLETLVERIQVAPNAPEWFRDLVQKVCQRYGIKKKVSRSNLDKEPLF